MAPQSMAGPVPGEAEQRRNARPVVPTASTLLGAAAERTGLDRTLKANTVKRRTHSLYRQGLYFYGAIPTMRKGWLVPLMKAFDEIVREHAHLSEILGVAG